MSIPAKTHRLTMLNSMAGRDFQAALDRHAAWGLDTLDLKDAVLGKSVAALTADEARRAAELIGVRGLRVATRSTGFFFLPIERGPEVFAEQLRLVETFLPIARILKPDAIRLIMPHTSQRATIADAVAHVQAQAPFVFETLAAAVDAIAGAGFRTVIETEPGDTLLASVAEVGSFFAWLGRREHVGFTWDVQNCWVSGIPPTLESYQQLRPLIAMLHLKGGIADPASGELQYASGLAEASWPVREIVGAAIRDGVSPVLCLNPSHGKRRPGHVDDYQRDIAFLRGTFPEIA